MAVNKISMGINYRKKTNSRMTGSGNYFAEVDRRETLTTRIGAQRQALRRLLEELHERYPRALIVGHHDLNPLKACPCFDAAHEYKDLQLFRLQVFYLY